MFVNENNQSDLRVNISTCNCQKNVFEAIRQFLSNHGFPVGGEGMCVEICQLCYDNNGENLVLRPESSASEPNNDLLFYVTMDSMGPTKHGYEMYISFHTEDEEYTEDEKIDLKRARKKIKSHNLKEFID